MLEFSEMEDIEQGLTAESSFCNSVMVHPLYGMGLLFESSKFEYQLFCFPGAGVGRSEATTKTKKKAENKNR